MPASVPLTPASAENRSQHVFVILLLFSAGVFVTIQLLGAVQSQTLTIANVTSLIFGCILVLGSYRLTYDWLSPAVLLSGIWSITLFLGTFDIQFLGRYAVFNGPIYPSTWVMLIGAIVSFLFGAILGSSFFGKYQASWTERTHDPRQIRRVVYLSFAIAALGYGVCYLSAGTAPILVDDLNEVRASFRLSKYGLLMLLFMVTIAFSAYLCGTYGVVANWRLVILSFLSFVFMLSTTERADSFQTFVVGGVTYLIARRNASRTRTGQASTIRAFIPLGIAGAALTSAFLYVGSARASGDRGVQATQIVDVESDLLAQLYIYSYVPSIKNLQWGAEQRIEHTYGLLFFRPLLWLTGNAESLPEDIDFGGVNTVTWLWYYYRDFGPLGTVLIPLFLGFISSLIHSFTVKKPSLLSIALYGLIVSCIIWTTGTERFCETMTFIYGGLLFGADRLCRTKSSPRPAVMRGIR